MITRTACRTTRPLIRIYIYSYLSLSLEARGDLFIAKRSGRIKLHHSVSRFPLITTNSSFEREQPHFFFAKEDHRLFHGVVVSRLVWDHGADFSLAIRVVFRLPLLPPISSGVASFPPRPSHRVSRYYPSLYVYTCSVRSRVFPGHSGHTVAAVSVFDPWNFEGVQQVCCTLGMERIVVGPMSLHEITHRVGLSSGLAALSTERERERERKLVGRNRFSFRERSIISIRTVGKILLISVPPSS